MNANVWQYQRLAEPLADREPPPTPVNHLQWPQETRPIPAAKPPEGFVLSPPGGFLPEVRIDGWYPSFPDRIWKTPLPRLGHFGAPPEGFLAGQLELAWYPSFPDRIWKTPQTRTGIVSSETTFQFQFVEGWASVHQDWIHHRRPTRTGTQVVEVGFFSQVTPGWAAFQPDYLFRKHQAREGNYDNPPWAFLGEVVVLGWASIHTDRHVYRRPADTGISLIEVGWQQEFEEGWASYHPDRHEYLRPVDTGILSVEPNFQFQFVEGWASYYPSWLEHIRPVDVGTQVVKVGWQYELVQGVGAFFPDWVQHHRPTDVGFSVVEVGWPYEWVPGWGSFHQDKVWPRTPLAPEGSLVLTKEPPLPPPIICWIMPPEVPVLSRWTLWQDFTVTAPLQSLPLRGESYVRREVGRSWSRDVGRGFDRDEDGRGFTPERR
jgi:hypothetical protein